MDKKNNSFFKDISFYVFLGCVLLCVSMFLYATISLVKFISGSSESNYKNIIQIIFSIACILILTIYYTYIKFCKIDIKQPLNIYYLIFILVFLGVYPCFSLFNNSIAFGVFCAFLGFTFSVIGITFFFHFNKLQNGSVKANPIFMSLFIFSFSIFVCVFILSVAYAVSKLNNTEIISSISQFIYQILYSVIGSIFATILVVISLYKSKRFVNLCLIKRISD